MAILAQQTIVGNVGRVNELRTVGSKNTAVLDFAVAVTPRVKNGDNWEDGETYWVSVTAWDKLAENIAASFKVGDRVFVHGRVDMKPGYTNKEGVEVAARPIVIAQFAGLEVSYAAAESKRQRSGGGSAQAKPAAAAPAEDMFSNDDFDFDSDVNPF